jgi:hypothetical protein
MAEVVERLLSNCEVLSSNPSSTKKMNLVLNMELLTP